MKKVLIGCWIIIQILGFEPSLQAQPTNDWKANDLRGKVKQIHQKVYKSYKKNGKIKLMRMKAEQKMLFDKSGYLQESMYRYIGYGGNGKWKTTKYTYNKRNQCTGFKKFNGETLTSACEYTLKKGQVIAQKYMDEKGQVLGITSYRRNRKGLVIEEKMTKSDGIVLQKTIYKYDRKKRIVYEKGWKKGKFQYEHKTSYLTKEERVIRKFDKTGKLTSFYEEKENITSEGKITTNNYYDAPKKFTKKEHTQFNSQGEKVLRRIYNADGSEQKYNYMRYAYKYDKQSNWVRQIEFLANGNSLDVSFREITYYE
ncbi:hypothetical protein BKI52_12780 [marine bacterium AO1-C]|nr:hypothetical protein BKI52_12780 [marine bacterium AO1-C]